MAKKTSPKNPDSTVALAELGVELSMLAKRVDALAARMDTSDRRHDEAKWMPLHLITANQQIEGLKADVERLTRNCATHKAWWRFWA